MALTRLVQSLAPASTGWAQWIFLYRQISLVSALAGHDGGPLPGGLPEYGALCFLWPVSPGWNSWGSTLAHWWPGPVRPDLVRVAQQLSGYSFPSVHALVYASTAGFLAVLFAVKTSGRQRITGVVMSGAVLLTGFAASLALGAHWPSDLLLSSLIGFLWATFLIRLPLIISLNRRTW